VFNLGSKSFLGIGAFSLAVALVYSLASSDYPGAVMATVAVVGIGMAALAGTGSADRFALLHSEQSSADRPTPAPFLAALGVGFVGLSLALGAPALVGGLIVGAVALLAWFSASWRSHPDVVASMQPRISDRFSLPFGMPLALLGIIAIVALSLSRSLLATSERGSWILAAIVGITIFAGLILWAWKPESKVLRNALLALALIAVIALAVAGLAAGERNFHEEKSGENALALIRT
jgi:hypothetical protein